MQTRSPGILSRTRPAWRLVDLGAGLALGILLMLLLQVARAPASSASPGSAWQSGPWPGCTLINMSRGEYEPISGAIVHEVTASWVCASLLPPAVITHDATPSIPAGLGQ